MKKDSKQKLLQAGARIIVKKGFNDAGLQEIVNTAGVPKGSFYFYFKSKEDFGTQLIDFYADFFGSRLREILSHPEGPHLAKIRRYLDWQADYMEANGFEGGCPFGILAQEMADRSDRFRERIQVVFDRLRRQIAGVLDQARTAGEIRPEIDPLAAADHIICAWQGVLMQMKVARNPRSREIFNEMIFDRLLAPAAA